MALWQSRSIQWCTQTLPCPCQAHTDDTWMTGRGQLRFPLVSILSDFQYRLFRVFLIFFFRTDGNNVHTENLCTTSKMGLHAIGVNVFCPNRNICWRQESLALLVAGSFPAAWFTLAGLLCPWVHPSYYTTAHSKQLTCASVTSYCKISRAKFFHP